MPNITGNVKFNIFYTLSFARRKTKGLSCAEKKVDTKVKKMNKGNF